MDRRTFLRLPATTSATVSTGVVNLVSGRFAIIDNGLGFQLVPWHPALDTRMSQHIAGPSSRRWRHRVDSGPLEGTEGSACNVINAACMEGKAGAKSSESDVFGKAVL
jgi:Protein of unknown function (DUF3363)